MELKKKAGIVVLIFNNIDLKLKLIKRDKDFILIKGTNIQKTYFKVWKMAQQLREPVALPDNLGSVPSFPAWWLTTICNS